MPSGICPHAHMHPCPQLHFDTATYLAFTMYPSTHPHVHMSSLMTRVHRLHFGWPRERVSAALRVPHQARAFIWPCRARRVESFITAPLKCFPGAGTRPFGHSCVELLVWAPGVPSGVWWGLRFGWPRESVPAAFQFWVSARPRLPGKVKLIPGG